MIRIKGVNKYFGNPQVLKNINVEINKGEIFGLVGHSGAGKSTLLRCINGLESYEDGSITVNNKEIKDLTSKELREFRKDLGMIFQHFSLLERLNVYENVALPLECWGYSKEEINNFLSVTSIKCKYKDSSNKLQDKEIKFIPSSNKLFIKDVTASSGYEIGDYVDKVLISKENSDKIIDIKLKLSKNKQIYETKFTIDIINFKGEDI